MRISTDPDALQIVDLDPASKIDIVAIYDQDDTWIDIVDLNGNPYNGGMYTVAYLEMGCLVDRELALLALKYWVRVNRSELLTDENIRQTAVSNSRELVEA